jgi:aminoglycoside 6-adenylyltransferase
MQLLFMRNEQELMALIVDVANRDDRIRAVLLNGSRANPTISKDIFQDYDIVYVVRNMSEFLANHNWIDVFGERLILQLPEEMTFGEKDDHAFHYLMLFKDGNRIDLTLFPVDKLEVYEPDSLTVLLLDKDNLFKNLPPPGEEDYLIRPPTQKEFSDCCNEFWWVSTYVAKGLRRKEIIYAKEMLEIPVRSMFLKIIEWYIGIKTNFSVSPGHAGKRMKYHISPELYNKILSTYPDSSISNIWNSLFTMTNVFSDLANNIAQVMHFNYDWKEGQNVKDYLARVHSTTTN